MNTEQLYDMASNTIGTVVDTDEITVDVLGIIKSGNTASIMLRVTANQLDSFLYDNGIEPLKNYRFNDETSWIDRNTEQSTIGYYYCDDDKELKPNQFDISFTIISKDTFDKEVYTVVLENFGYFTKGNEYGTDFVSIYDDVWKFDISLDSKNDFFESVYVNKVLSIEDYNIILDTVHLSPFNCTIQFRYDSEYTEDIIRKVYDSFSEKVSDITINLKDGTILDNKQFRFSSSRERSILGVIINFNVPLSVDDVSSISMFGESYSIINK